MIYEDFPILQKGCHNIVNIVTLPPTLWKVAATIYCYMGSTVSTAATAANGEQFDKSDFFVHCDSKNGGQRPFCAF